MSIRCTVLLATLLLIGVLYVFTTYAVDVAYGPEGLRRVRQPDRKRVLIYILMCAACIGYFARRPGGFNWLSHLIIPLLGIAAFVPAWLTSAGIKVFSFVTPLAPPLSYMGPGVAGFMVLGVIYMIYLYWTNPGRIIDVGLAHLEGDLG